MFFTQFLPERCLTDLGLHVQLNELKLILKKNRIVVENTYYKFLWRNFEIPAKNYCERVKKGEASPRDLEAILKSYASVASQEYLTSSSYRPDFGIFAELINN